MFYEIKPIKNDLIPPEEGHRPVAVSKDYYDQMSPLDRRAFEEKVIYINIMQVKGISPVSPRYEGNRDKEDNPRINIDATEIVMNDGTVYMVEGRAHTVQYQMNKAFAEGLTIQINQRM